MNKSLYLGVVIVEPESEDDFKCEDTLYRVEGINSFEEFESQCKSNNVDFEQLQYKTLQGNIRFAGNSEYRVYTIKSWDENDMYELNEEASLPRILLLAEISGVD